MLLLWVSSCPWHVPIVPMNGLKRDGRPIRAQGQG